MKITALVENTTSDPKLGCEHGLSLWIETGGRKLLFDMGETALFAENAQKLGIDLAEAELAILSHGHHDHGGGLTCFLELNKTAPVYLSRYAFDAYYSDTGEYAGIDAALKDDPRLISTGDEMAVAANMHLYSCNARERKHDFGSFGLTMLRDGRLLPDDFRHEQYLLVEEEGRRILISGCSHKGIMNLVDWFQPDVAVGGFHFMMLPAGEELASYTRQLKATGTTFYTCHCTGIKQYGFMQPRMSRLSYLSTGQSIVI